MGRESRMLRAAQENRRGKAGGFKMPHLLQVPVASKTLAGPRLQLRTKSQVAETEARVDQH